MNRFVEIAISDITRSEQGFDFVTVRMWVNISNIAAIREVGNRYQICFYKLYGYNNEWRSLEMKKSEVMSIIDMKMSVDKEDESSNIRHIDL